MTLEKTVRAMDPEQKVKIGTDGGSGFWFCGRAREFLEGPKEMIGFDVAHRYRSISEKGVVILLAAPYGGGLWSGDWWLVSEAEQAGTPWAIRGKSKTAIKQLVGRQYGKV